MNPKKLINSFMLCQDMINIFISYSKQLDDYFTNVNNRYDHDYLYNLYLELKKQLQDVSVKRGVIKK